jgi:hypothetical protein
MLLMEGLRTRVKERMTTVKMATVKVRGKRRRRRRRFASSNS